MHGERSKMMSKLPYRGRLVAAAGVTGGRSVRLAALGGQCGGEASRGFGLAFLAWKPNNNKKAKKKELSNNRRLLCTALYLCRY